MSEKSTVSFVVYFPFPLYDSASRFQYIELAFFVELDHRRIDNLGSDRVCNAGHRS